MRICYDGTYGCFIDSTYGFFIDTTCIFSLIKDITGRPVRRAGKGQESGILPLLALSLMFKDMPERENNKMNRMDKNF